MNAKDATTLLLATETIMLYSLFLLQMKNCGLIITNSGIEEAIALYEGKS